MSHRAASASPVLTSANHRPAPPERSAAFSAPLHVTGAARAVRFAVNPPAWATWGSPFVVRAVVTDEFGNLVRPARGTPQALLAGGRSMRRARARVPRDQRAQPSPATPTPPVSRHSPNRRHHHADAVPRSSPRSSPRPS